MQVFRDLVPTTEYTAVALGYFDGVHMGHKQVLSAAAECKALGLTPVAFTFSSTPKASDVHSQLSTYEEKLNLMESLGIEVLYIIDFDRIRDKSPFDFAEHIVKDVFNAKKVFCGFNYHFGKMGAGDAKTLVELCKGLDIEANIIDPVMIDGTLVSSTAIRSLLKEGKIKEANKLLGYDYGIVSTSVKGNHIGTKLDTPTINQPFEKDMALPKFGVYASLVTIDDEIYYGVTNIGVKPTIADNYKPICETWLPQFKGGDLYGKRIETRLKAFVRPEQKFNSLEELKAAIKKDGQTALEILKDFEI